MSTRRVRALAVAALGTAVFALAVPNAWAAGGRVQGQASTTTTEEETTTTTAEETTTTTADDYAPGDTTTTTAPGATTAPTAAPTTAGGGQAGGDSVTLPRTGASGSGPLTLLGFGLAVVGVALLALRRPRASTR